MKYFLVVLLSLIVAASFGQGKRITIKTAGGGSSGVVTETDPVWSSVSGNYELLANKAIDFGVLDNTKYPTTLAVSDYITGLDYLTISSAAATYSLLGHTHAYSSLTGLPTLFTQVDADALYQPIGTYATATNSMTFTNKSGLISQWTNDVGYALSSDSGYLKFLAPLYAYYDNDTLVVEDTSTFTGASYVPYVGATGTVDLNSQNLTTTGNLVGTLTGSLHSGGGYQQSSTFINSNFAVTNTSAGTSSSNANVQIGGADARLRTMVRGNTSLTPAAGENGYALIFGTNDMTEASSGTHNIFAQLALKPLTITAGAASTTNAVGVYIEGPPTGATNNYPLWVDDGITRLDGDFELHGIATTTELNVLYYNTATKKVTYGATPGGGGSSSLNYAAKTANYTVTGSDDVLEATSGSFTFTLPAVATPRSTPLYIKNIGTGAVNVQANGSEKIDLSNIQTIYYPESLILFNTGTKWIILNK